MLHEDVARDIRELDGSPVDSNLVRRVRKDMGWTQYELAEMLCTSQPYISKIESTKNDDCLRGASAKLFRLFHRYGDLDTEA